jgi:hypothetical protein
MFYITCASQKQRSEVYFILLHPREKDLNNDFGNDFEVAAFTASSRKAFSNSCNMLLCWDLVLLIYSSWTVSFFYKCRVAKIIFRCIYVSIFLVLFTVPCILNKFLLFSGSVFFIGCFNWTISKNDESSCFHKVYLNCVLHVHYIQPHVRTYSTVEDPFVTITIGIDCKMTIEQVLWDGQG